LYYVEVGVVDYCYFDWDVVDCVGGELLVGYLEVVVVVDGLYGVVGLVGFGVYGGWYCVVYCF